MANLNLGNVVGLLRSQVAPTKKYVLWGKILNPSFPDIVEINYWDEVGQAWIPVTDPTHQYWLRPVIDNETVAPPVSPAEGDRYLIPLGATGAWSGKTDQIATRKAAAWSYTIPLDGYIVTVASKPNRLFDYRGNYNTGQWYENNFNTVGDFIPTAQKGVYNGVATLDSLAKVPQVQLDADNFAYNPSSPGNWPVGINKIRSALDYLILASGAVVNNNIYQEVGQATHGFLVGDILTINGAGIYIKITNPNTQKAVGIVQIIEDANNFTMVMAGFVSNLSGLVAGSIYYVQASGTLTTTPTALPYLIAKSATEGYTLSGGGDVKGLDDILAVDNQSGGFSILFTGGTGMDTTATGGTDILNIGTDNADVINIGRVGSTVNIQGTLAYQNVTNLQVTDKLITLNKGGGAASANGAGIEFEEGGSVTGYISTTGSRNGYDFKAPAIAGVATLSFASLTSSRVYTMPDAGGTIILDTANQTLTTKTIALGSNTISGTKAQFNTALSDGDFLFVGDISGVSDGDKGDITVTGSGAVWTVDPTAISGKTIITTVDITNDYLLIWDATDSLLKKVAPTNLGLSGGGGDMLLGSTQTVTALKTFNSGTIALRNPANTFSYNILGSALAADRTLTIPLLTAGDVFVTEAHNQTLTNKTLNLTSNTLSGTKAQFDAAASDGNFMWIGDAPSAHTLDSHSNVTITANSTGEILKWSGAAWINNTLAEASISAVGHTHTLTNVTDVTATVAEVNLLDLAGLTTGWVLRATGAATAAWSALGGSDITGAALTKTDDTNVVLTLGGTPATALLRAASLTLSWSGTLAVARGGSGAGTLTGVVIGNGTSAMSAVIGTASQLLRRNAGNTAYEFFTPTYLTANETITLSGDISGSGTTTITTTIGVNKVTLGMMAQVATSTFLGRVTAATGNVEALTTAQATGMLDLFSTTTTTRGLVVGSNNVGATFFLNGNGVWAVPAGGGDMVLASVQNVSGEKTFDTTKLALYNPAKTFKYIVATSALITADKTITLPLLTAGDVFVFEAFTQTLTNKTIALGSNTVSGTKAQFSTAVSDGDILYVGDAVTAIGVTTANGVSGTSSGGTTPNLTLTLGAITPTTVNGLTLAAQAVGFTIAGGTTSKTLTISNTLTFAGTDTSTLNIGTGGTLGTAAYTASTAYLASATNSTQDGYFTGVRLLESVGATFYTRIINGQDLTVNRTLTLIAGDADRTLTIAGTASVNGTNTGDQTITLTSDVTGSGTGSFATTIAVNVVTYAKMQQASAGFTIMAKATTAAGNYAELAAGIDSILMRQASGNLVFSTIVTNHIGASQVTYAKIQNASVGYTIMAKATTAAGAYAELTAGVDSVLRRSGSGDIAFGTLVTNNIGDAQVTLAKIQNIATSSFLGRITAASGVTEVLTTAQATSLLDLFATGSTTKGLVPGSNSVGATFFLNATGAWSVPAGGSGWAVTGNTTITGNTSQTGAFTNTFLMDGIIITQNVVAGGAKALTVTPGAHTGIATTTELIVNDFAGASITWAAGVTATQRFNYFRAFTMVTGTATNTYTVYIEPSTGGTNNYALGLNGPMLATSSIDASTTSFNLINNIPTTVVFANAASTLSIGATAGTMTLRNPNIVSGATASLFDTISTTITFGAAAGTMTIGYTGTGASNTNLSTGAATATKTINIGTGSGTTSTTAINIGTGSIGTAVNVTIGTNITGSTTSLLSQTIVGTSTVANLWNTAATTISFGGAGTNVTIGGTPTTGSITLSLFPNATASTHTKNVLIGTGGVVGSTTLVQIGATTTTSSVVIESPIIRLTSAVTGGSVVNDNFLMWNATIGEVKRVALTGTPSSTTFLRGDGAWATAGGGGDVTGPAGGVINNEIAVYNSTTGKIIKGSGGATLSGNVIFLGGLNVSGAYAHTITSSTNPINLQRNTANTNIGMGILTLTVASTGTPTVGLGAMLEFSVHTSSVPNYETGGVIAVIQDVVTGGAEDFQMSFRTMSAGAAATERLRLTHTAANAVNGAVFKENNVAISPIGKQDIWIPASAMWPRVTNGASAVTKAEIATSLVNVQYIEFSGGGTNSYAQFLIQLPRNWDGGTITFRAHWYGTVGSGTVIWSVKAGAYSDDDALTTALGTAQTSTDTFILADDNHISPRSAAITVAGTPADEDLIAVEIMRDTVTDTNASPARLLGITIEVTTNAAVAA